MVFIDKPESLKKIWTNRKTTFTELLKFVVDIENEWIVIDGEMHADCEAVLLEKGSKQENVWGGNVYPDNDGPDYLEFTSFINIRPSLNNSSMEIQDSEIRAKVSQIIHRLLLR